MRFFASIPAMSSRSADRLPWPIDWGGVLMPTRDFENCFAILRVTSDELYCLLAPDRQIHDSSNFETEPDQQVVAIAREQIDENRFGDAVALLESSTLYDLKHPAAASLLARIYSEMGRFKESLSILKEYEQTADANPDFGVALGNVLLDHHRYEQASDAFLGVIESDPLHSGALAGLARALESLGRSDEAIPVITRVQLAKDLQEVGLTIATGGGSAGNLSSILAGQLEQVGLPLESVAYRFNGLEYRSPRLAKLETYHAELSDALERSSEEEAATRRRCGLPPPHPIDRADWTSLNGDSGVTSFPQTTGDRGDEEIQPPTFVDVASTVGLDFQYQNASPPIAKHFLLHQALGSGIACLDFDRDGRVDVYACQGAGNPTSFDQPSLGNSANLLARNLGDRFSDVTVLADADDRGYSMGITAGDINQDGFADLVIGNMSANRVLLNQGDGTFRHRSLESSSDRFLYTTGLAIADVSGDSLPDIIEVNYVDDPRIFEPLILGPSGVPTRLPGPMQFPAAPDRVFVNGDDGNFHTFDLGAGPSLSDRFAIHRAMGLVVGDFNGDHRNEIFVANDQTQNQYWVVDRASGAQQDSAVTAPVFRDIAIIAGVASGVSGQSLASMGIAADDFDLDGRIDFHVTNFDDEISNLYCQIDPDRFVDRVFRSGLDDHSRGLMGFGTQSLDYNNDGDPDIVVGNGDIEDHRPEKPRFAMPTQILVNHHGRFMPSEPSDDSGYFARGHLTRSVVRLDWNNDGRTDFLAGDLLEPLALLENRTINSKHWIHLDLVGRISERDAIGAKVRIEADERTSVHAVVTGDGYMGRNQSTLMIGLGDHDRVNVIQIAWPSGKRQEWTRIPGDRRYMMIEGDSVPFAYE